MKASAEAVAKERARIEEVYQRREIEVDKDLYAPWQPAANLMVAERKRIAASLLRKMGKFPERGDRCLEIGHGRLGWLADLLSWGLKESDLHGVELDTERALFAKQAFPNADLRIGDATDLPWPNDSFDFVVMSTVLSSILDNDIRRTVVDETKRVLSRGGVVIWYDLAIDNPKNDNVRGIGARELKMLFPEFNAVIRSVTLAPPIARLVAPNSVLLTAILNSFPFLRTHVLGILVKI
jgi:ubiquinone/menaquinone biosynthesis C-methylase UbiE